MPSQGEPMREAVRPTARQSATGAHAFAERPSYKLYLSERPGLGISFHDDVVRKYRQN